MLTVKDKIKFIQEIKNFKWNYNNVFFIININCNRNNS